MLFRKAYKNLKKWYDSNNKKALLVDGARQVGKTFLIREFLKKNSNSFIELNLYENDLAKEAFKTINNAKELLIKISALATKTLIKGETVIFIDEVQAVDDIITKVKFLIEDGSYRYIFSGSLLGICYNNIDSLPVGYIDILEMYPLDFEEFAIANGVSRDTINYLEYQFKNLLPIDNIVHKQMINLFNLYTIVGGFPEVVDKFIQTPNLQDVFYLHESIDKLYKLDISKYTKEKTLLVKDIYSLIPSELN
ncbi:MAG TPA: AAA family ATPase, partial [Firmicutes bacterium]|nr:AAA family ATPase [Bacillota bacterium]